MSGKLDAQVYRSELKAEFSKLLHTAEKRNQMYFLMILFTNWPSIKWSNLFYDRVNEITSRLLWQRLKTGLAEPMQPHETLFLLQVNLEAKAHYALLKNFTSLVLGNRAAPEPWEKRRGEYTVNKKGRANVSTTVILRNLGEDLRCAGFGRLADELEVTHVKSMDNIRHAIAHAAFSWPCPEHPDEWVFGKYIEAQPGYVGIEVIRYTHDEFQDTIRRFFAFRLAYLDAVTECRARLGDLKFAFQANNQMKPGEILDCTFDRGTVGVKYKGTPLW